MRKLLIIGSGMATAHLLQNLVEGSHNYSIVVIGAEPVPSYNRILLSGVLAGKNSEEDLRLFDEDWYRKNNIRLYTNEGVIEIDLHNRRVLTVSGRREGFDKLVLATGSRPFYPPIPGIDSAVVSGFRNLADLRGIRERATSASRAVVIGGGLLGLEAAWGLAGLGLEVTVVNREPRLMPRQLDEQAAGVLRSSLEERGILFQLGTVPSAIELGDSGEAAVVLENGTGLPADMVLVAAGIVPNADIAKAAGIDCNRGILVDSAMGTSHSDVYALGECCQMDGRLFGLVDPIYRQCSVLAGRLRGEDRHYGFTESATQLKIAGLDVVSAGSLPFPGAARSQIILDRDRRIYRRLVFHDRRLIGYMLIGDSRHKSWYRDLLESGAEVTPDNSRMMFVAGGEDHGNFDCGTTAVQAGV